jgi:hypothetical protein
MGVRAKFVCRAIDKTEGHTPHESVRFEAVTADTEENKTWSKYTPWGELRMSITNPAAFGRFAVGQEIFVELTPAG